MRLVVGLHVTDGGADVIVSYTQADRVSGLNRVAVRGQGYVAPGSPSQ